MAVVVTVAKGYDLDYIWKTQGQPIPSVPAAGTTSTPSRPANHQADGGAPEPKPSASEQVRSSSASRTTRCTSSRTHAPA